MGHQHLFTKIFNTVKEGTDVSAYLKNVTEEYPYFGLAQFYSLKNSVPNSPSYNDVAAKTALFFSSNFYLQSQLVDRNYVHTNPVLSEILPTSNGADVKKTEEDTSVKKEEILFEPLHASDYFASQGIKLSEDALGADKLGKQLKSFTAWLKTMKKVHPDKLPAVTTITETAVQTQAEKSNIEEEVVTEPMAEAYILQNKLPKAIDIYNKLSLLNPAKSAYFAAKIDSLKK